MAVESAADLIAAAINRRPGLDEAGRAAVSWALKEKIRVYIDANLGDPELGPDSLQRTFRISRATLYRSFAAESGVAQYILKRRLELAFRRLRDAHRTTGSITSLAYSLGFSSPSVFTRAFKRRFGATPKEVRHLATRSAELPGEGAGDRLWERWLADF